MGVDGDGVDLDAAEIGEDLRFAVRLDAVELGSRAASGVEIALGILGHGPEVGGAGVEELVGARREREQAVGAQREVADDAFFKIGEVALGPGVRLAGECEACGGKQQGEVFGHRLKSGPGGWGLGSQADGATGPQSPTPKPGSFYFTWICRE